MRRGEAFGEDDSRAVFEWRDVRCHTEKGLAVRSEQVAGDLDPQGRFSECAAVAGEQDESSREAHRRGGGWRS